MKLDFIKGHMGGNTIVFLEGEQLSKGRELDISLEILGDEKLCCHEAGLLYPSRGDEDLRVRIVGRASKKYISACGGLTQVLGQVLLRSEWGERFGINPGSGDVIRLGTEAGVVAIRIQETGNRRSAITDMTPFLAEIYKQGLESLELCGISAWRIGKFLVINAERLREAFPEDDIENLGPASRDQIVMIQNAYLERFPFAGLDLALFDGRHAREDSSFRVVFPHSIPTGLIEPSCGTGSVAVCLAAQLEGAFPDMETGGGERSLSLGLECGGGPRLGGPDTTWVTLHPGVEGRLFEKVFFHHSNVEIICEGRVYLT